MRWVREPYWVGLDIWKHGRPPVNDVLCGLATSLMGSLILQLQVQEKAQVTAKTQCTRTGWDGTCHFLVRGAMGSAKLLPPIKSGCGSCKYAVYNSIQ